MTGHLLRALAAAAVLSLSAPALGAEHDTAPAPEAAAGVAEARSLMRAGRFDEALAVLAPLVRGEAVQADALFQYGLAAIGAAQRPDVSEEKRDALLDEAIAAFHGMLVRRPELIRVRLELARAFFFKGEDRLARRHFEQVLAGEVPPPVAANVGRFLAQIRARRRWSARFGFALAPDTNIGATSDERVIYIDVGGARLPFTRDAEELTSSGVGLSVWTGGEYQHPLSQRWRLRAGGNLSRRDYSGSRFDQTFLSAHAGPRWLISRRSEASLLASAQRRWSATAPDHDALGARLEARHRLTRRMTANLRASWHDRSYRTRTYLDGPVVDASLGGTVVVSPTVRADAAAGWGLERPKQERQRHDRRWVRAGVSVALPGGFTVGGSGEVRWADYEGSWVPHTRAGESREDRTYNARLSVHNRGLSWQGFSPQVSMVHEVRKTNAQLYDYERTGGELRFVRVF